MVSYQEWTSIVFEVAPADASAPDVVSWAAEKWRSRKADIMDASKSEARQWARKQLR